MSIDNFTLYFLTGFARNSKVIDLVQRENIWVSIPSNYKDIIESILNENESWREEFSVFIDMEQYFTDHFKWEEDFVVSLEKTLNILGKRISYNLQTDNLEFCFSKEELALLSSETNNKELSQIMDHFVTLIQNSEYTRDYRKSINRLNKSISKQKKLFGISDKL